MRTCKQRTGQGKKEPSPSLSFCQSKLFLLFYLVYWLFYLQYWLSWLKWSQWKLTEEGASSVDLADPVTVAGTCQTVQLMVNGHHGILSQTWETVKKFVFMIPHQFHLHSLVIVLFSYSKSSVTTELLKCVFLSNIAKKQAKKQEVDSLTHLSCSSYAGRRCQHIAWRLQAAFSVSKGCQGNEK